MNLLSYFTAFNSAFHGRLQHLQQFLPWSLNRSHSSPTVLDEQPQRHSPPKLNHTPSTFLLVLGPNLGPPKLHLQTHQHNQQIPTHPTARRPHTDSPSPQIRGSRPSILRNNNSNSNSNHNKNNPHRSTLPSLSNASSQDGEMQDDFPGVWTARQRRAEQQQQQERENRGLVDAGAGKGERGRGKIAQTIAVVLLVALGVVVVMMVVVTGVTGVIHRNEGALGEGGKVEDKHSWSVIVDL